VSVTREQLVELTNDPAPFLGDEDPVLRRLAVTALSREQARAHIDTVTRMAADEDVAVRTAAAEKLGVCGEQPLETLVSLTSDDEPTVREAVATAFGEIGSPVAVDRLIDAAMNDADRHVREAAVAALGSIADPRALDTLLEIIRSSPPQVRRRTIAAITVFDDERVEPAIRRAALDRNPGVREAAEMVVGKQLSAVGHRPSADEDEPKADGR